MTAVRLESYACEYLAAYGGCIRGQVEIVQRLEF
jgi:hypothetical protein